MDLQRRPTSRPTKTKFSRFFRKILVQLDKEIYKPHDIIEWDKAQSHGDIDGFEIKRAGDVEINAKIILHLDYAPRYLSHAFLAFSSSSRRKTLHSRFKLAPILGAALGIHTDTKPKIVLAMWRYIRVSISDRLQWQTQN